MSLSSTRLFFHQNSELIIYISSVSLPGCPVIVAVFYVVLCVHARAVFSPLLRLSPPPSEKDYYFNLDENEGVCDLFDIPL